MAKNDPHIKAGNYSAGCFQECHGNGFGFQAERILPGSDAGASGQISDLCAADLSVKRCHRGQHIPAV